jgi:hypothetical protein
MEARGWASGREMLQKKDSEEERMNGGRFFCFPDSLLPPLILSTQYGFRPWPLWVNLSDF